MEAKLTNPTKTATPSLPATKPLNAVREPLPGKTPPVVAATSVRFRHRILLRLLIMLGLAALVLFLYWLSDQQFAGFRPLYYLLLISIGYRVLKVLFEWYHYWAIRNPPPPPQLKRNWTVDMLTTAMPGEPYELIRDTLEAMVAVRYPHTTYLCDEGNDPQLKALCASLGVRHVTREVKVDAKAGNINNALRTATGEICVVLDPDHRPVPQMLHEVLPYFEDNQIGFVQSVQAYKNAGDSLVARGAAEQTYTFYGPMMMGMSHYGTAQAIGANCVFRRAALDSIGGHAAGLSEDMHTAMQLHAKGWKSVYLPKILTRGLVPSNISAYYKQQLKWSRGTFELLFVVLPTLLRRLTWRQKLHYSLIPLHFAAGIIAFIDILIPLLALASGEVPLLIEFSKAYLFLMPFLAMIILVRQYAQRWLLERQERGFHLTGGILLFGSWWVLLVGFVYTLFRVKVPYIPTPKEDEYTSNLKLCLPNLLVVLATAGIVWVSLQKDSNPYNLLMGGYALCNACFLLIAVWMGQDRWRRQAFWLIKTCRPLVKPGRTLRNWGLKTASVGFSLMRLRAPQLALLLLCVFSLLGWRATHPVDPVEVSENKDLGGFYLGVNISQPHKYAGLVTGSNQKLPSNANMVMLKEFWGSNTDSLTDDLLGQLAGQHIMPVINWLPVHPNGESLVGSQGIMTAIAQGQFDAYLLQYARRIRQLGAPVMINFAPESDNPDMPWHVHRRNPLRDYINAFRHVQVLFLESGVNNVTWLWSIWKAGNMPLMFPGSGFVDWVGVGNVEVTKAKSFTKAFLPYHMNMRNIEKPIMLTHFNWNDDAASVALLEEVMEARREIFHEINGVVLSPAKPVAGALLPVASINQSAATGWWDNMIQALPELADLQNQSLPAATLPVSRSRQVTGTAGNFKLLHEGKPFYIRGVAYNPEQSWRDGYHPLNRKKLERDFKAIKEMGANTIRRYAPSANDRNILNVAAEQDLKVMYGFWFDPEIDYAKDHRKVEAYIRKVEQTVRKYKNEPVILAWNIGNESSGLLKHHFAQPYLTVVRRAYVAMIETMARRVHAIDPERPLLTSLEHARQLPGEVYSFGAEAPSIDIIAVNSYYKQWISQVHDIVHRFSPGKPYLISEFGPKGYWENHLNDLDQHKRLVEQTDKHKALLYAAEWNEDVQGHAGCNLGGIAFCWQDRFEGTATWFGLTDYMGRKKHAYFGLQQLWKGLPVPRLENLYVAGPTFTIKPGATYEFTAVYGGGKMPKLEWQLLSSDYLEPAGTISPGSAPNKVKVTFPSKGRNFRLYLYASPENGRVITASRPVTLFEGVFNEGI